MVIDSLHAATVLSGDLKEMDQYWTEDFMVTNPFNEIDRANRIRNGIVTLMGKEIVVPKGKSPDAGKTINRRYTNIWIKLNGQWRLVARQASIICS